jgi:DNA-directed RNA polymerase specialized sigma24 family protein
MSQPARRLDQISTYWPALGDPVQFTLRYAPAIERYLYALLRDPHEVEEALQDFLVRGLERGFVRPGGPLSGRFRDYLKAAVRNAAIDRLRQRRLPQQGDLDLTEVPGDEAEEADRRWVEQWRQCVLGRVWEALHAQQKRSAGNLFHLALRLAVEHPEEDSAALAARASAQSGQALSAEAFRKQLSRARRRFAELLVEEVRRTLQDSGRDRVEEELAALGLLSYVSGALGERE